MESKHKIIGNYSKQERSEAFAEGAYGSAQWECHRIASQRTLKQRDPLRRKGEILLATGFEKSLDHASPLSKGLQTWTLDGKNNHLALNVDGPQKKCFFGAKINQLPCNFVQGRRVKRVHSPQTEKATLLSCMTGHLGRTRWNKESNNYFHI